MTVTDAHAALYNAAVKITDPEVRQAVVAGVSQELNSAAALRTKGPEYARASGQFKSWATTYDSVLRTRVMPRGVTTAVASQMVKNRMDEAIGHIGRGDIKPENVGKFMSETEKDMDHWLDATFPPRRRTR